ncbi:MAG TPA: hypothetical protein VKY90_14465 [Candidatus Dormibacteraeota bacterium]|nr:hypothetical protein [Candidatus Dormibacteraeota bacterium]
MWSPLRPALATVSGGPGSAFDPESSYYKSFPDPAQLFTACQRHFLAQSPLPDLDPGAGDPGARLEQALARLYGWFRSNQAMHRHVHRDRHQVPDLDRLLKETLDAWLDAVSRTHADRLAGGRPAIAVRALVRLALEFRTWELLSDLGLEDRAIARLLARAASAITDEHGTAEGRRDDLDPGQDGPAAKRPA